MHVVPLEVDVSVISEIILNCACTIIISMTIINTESLPFETDIAHTHTHIHTHHSAQVLA